MRHLRLAILDGESRQRSRFLQQKIRRGFRCHSEMLEARQMLAGDLVGHWVADDISTQPDERLSWSDRVGEIIASRSVGSPVVAESALGGRDVVRFDASDSGDMLEVPVNANPLSQANDFSVIVAFATAANDLTGGNAEWYQNTGLVNSNTLGFSPDWGISLNAAGQAAFGTGVGLGQPSPTVYSTASGLNDGQLHVISATRSGSDLALYVDDQPADTRNDASSEARARVRVAFGGLLNRVNYFTGDIAEVRMYDGALTSNEVASIYGELTSYYNNSAPVAVADTYDAQEDSLLAIPANLGVLANDSDPDGDALTAVIETTTAHGTLSLLPNGSFLYAPDTDFSGVDTFRYRAVDFRGSEPVTVQINVAGIHDPPIALNDEYKTTPTGVLTPPFFMGVLANDQSREQGAVLTAQLERDVESGSLTLNEDGSFTFDPQGVAGDITFLYRANDGTATSNEATVTVVVNTPPNAAADSYPAVEDQPLIVSEAEGILSNDTDPEENSLTLNLISETTAGTLALSDDGSFTYTPSENFAGTDEFRYQLNDGLDDSTEATVQIQVAPVNDPPTATADRYFALVNQALEVPASTGVLTNDIDIDNPDLTAELVEGTRNGNLTLRADGSFQYTPNAGFDGTDQFRYRASDGALETDPVEVTLRITSQPIVINEFATSQGGVPTQLTTIVRATTEAEFEGEVLSPDWIELRNYLSEPIDLGGMYLTDDADTPTKWQFPVGTKLPGDGYLLVFASGRNVVDPNLDEQGRLHTNFRLATDAGSYLALHDESERLIHAIGDGYPEQRANITYGLATADPTVFGYFLTPTPGAANGESLLEMVADTRFSVDRGFYTEPIEVEVTTPTEGARIRYTTDGSDPTLGNGTDYSGPITISNTTTLRAAAFKDGYVSTNTDTHSYFFLTDVLSQSRQATLDAGFPERWRNQSSDYGIDDDSQLPRIAGDTNMSLEDAKAAIVESLQAVPSISVVMNIDDMFGDRGIYSNPERTGVDWEKASSIELLQPDGTDGFQIDAGIRVQGGAFRSFGLTRKKSFRLMFKSKYGDAQLNYPLFGAEANSSFDTLIMRMESNDGWQWSGAGGQPQYARDQYLRNVQKAMGQPASEGTSVHVYINGFYWGLYNLVERPDQSMGAAYFGADKYDWDGINSGTPINEGAPRADNEDRFRRNRTRNAWSTMFRIARDVDDANTEEERTALLMKIQGLNPDGSNNPEFEDWLDLENMIDYLIVNYYGHNSDWPFKNYYVGRENTPDSTGFKFFMWDAEWSLLLRSSVTGNNVTSKQGVAGPFGELRASKEFRVLFGDHVQKHFYNGGVFYVDPNNSEWDPDHPERNVPASMYAELADFVYPALVAESARWGDQHSGRPRTIEDWQREYDRIMKSWFPRRSREMIKIYQRLDLFPELETAVFNQRGGAITKDTNIELSAPAGQIFYTTDGSDPRLIGGDISPSAVAYDGGFTLDDSGTIRVRVLENNDWSAIDEAHFLVDVIPADQNNLRVSEVHYHPADPTDAEQQAGHTDADDFEFIELLNISSQTVDLSAVSLQQVAVGDREQGVSLDFAQADLQQLSAGERLVVVEDVDAFRFRYGNKVPVAGQWAGGLSNGSEIITVAIGDTILQQFSYSDDWHATTDGQGPSLEIINAENPNLESWGDAASWRPSGNPGGSPGSAGGVVAGDVNGDSIFNSTDLVLVMQAGKFEDDIPNNASYEEGDWNGDGDFTSSDLVFVFQAGTYQDEATAALPDAAIAAALAELAVSDSEDHEFAPLARAPQRDLRLIENNLGARDQIFTEDEYELLNPDYKAVEELSNDRLRDDLKSLKNLMYS
ncbi:MAG: hypothetical protein CMJ77_23430 [Planctomycetaceae bacterium]|nr:hypothetical protein [Planctomycetaceae bacterium]